jgi:hypothetical protein
MTSDPRPRLPDNGSADPRPAPAGPENLLTLSVQSQQPSVGSQNEIAAQNLADATAALALALLEHPAELRLLCAKLDALEAAARGIF